MILRLKILYFYLGFRIRSRGINHKDQLQKRRRKLERKFRKSLAKSEYYRPWLKSNKALSDFPSMNKKLFMEHFDSINTAGIKKDKAFELALKAEDSRDFSPMLHGISIGMSSGTSGNLSLFLASSNERARWVAAILHKLLGFSWRKRKVAFFLRANNNLYTSAGSSLITFCFFDLIRSKSENLEQLKEFNPDVLVAQPSMLREIAFAQKNGSLNIRPAKIISVAEILEPDDKMLLETVFNLQVDEAYQCTEGFLASTCRFGTLHFHEEFLVIKKKYVDKEKRRFHPVITDLKRITQPIINYELDDIIIEKGACSCGSACLAIEQIEGRADDVLKIENSDGSAVMVFPDFIRRAIITSSNEVSFYSVSQVGPSTVEVYLELIQESDREQIWKKVELGLKSLFSRLGIGKVELLPAPNFTHDSSSKLRRVRNEYSTSGQNHRSR